MESLFGGVAPTLDFNDAFSDGGLTLALHVEVLVPGFGQAGRFGSVTPPSQEHMSIIERVDEVTAGATINESNDWEVSGGVVGAPAAWDWTELVHVDPGHYYIGWTTDQFTSALGSNGNNPYNLGDVISSDGSFVGLEDDEITPARNCRFNLGPSFATAFPNGAGDNFYPIDFRFTPDADEPNEGSAAFLIDFSLAGVGARASRGAAAMGLNLAVAGSGARASKGVAALGLGLAVVTAGRRASRGVAALTLRLALNAVGPSTTSRPARLTARARSEALTARGAAARLVTRGGYPDA